MKQANGKQVATSQLEPGEMVLVDDFACYPGQDMRWTEVMGPGEIKKGETVYHWSGGIIEEFLAKETCFFWDVKNINSGHLYSFTALKDIRIVTDGNEVRVDLEQGMLLEYLGEFRRGPKYYNGEEI